MPVFNKRPRPEYRTKRTGAFTIIELLVAMAILVVIVMVLAYIAERAGFVRSEQSKKSEYRQTIRSIVFRMGNELSKAAIPMDRNAPTSTPNLQFITNPPALPASLANRSSVFFQTLTPNANMTNELQALGYFIRWINNKPVLCRAEIPSSNSLFTVYQSLNWIDPVALDTVAAGDKASGYQGLFLENVAGLWISCYDRNGTLLSGPDQSFNSRGSSGHSLPASLAIEVICIDQATLKRMPATELSSLQSSVASSTSADQVLQSSGIAPQFLSKFIVSRHNVHMAGGQTP